MWRWMACHSNTFSKRSWWFHWTDQSDLNSHKTWFELKKYNLTWPDRLPDIFSFQVRLRNYLGLTCNTNVIFFLTWSVSNSTRSVRISSNVERCFVWTNIVSIRRKLTKMLLLMLQSLCTAKWYFLVSCSVSANTIYLRTLKMQIYRKEINWHNLRIIFYRNSKIRFN